MKLLDLSISSLILRFYLLMAIVIVAGFSGYWSISLLALPVFFTPLMGIKISWPKVHPGRPKTDSPGWQHAH
ncbi:MAG: hypothetical protein ABJB16_03875 [Saprospiraceae bacterium]